MVGRKKGPGRSELSARHWIKGCRGWWEVLKERCLWHPHGLLPEAAVLSSHHLVSFLLPRLPMKWLGSPSSSALYRQASSPQSPAHQWQAVDKEVCMISSQMILGKFHSWLAFTKALLCTQQGFEVTGPIILAAEQQIGLDYFLKIYFWYLELLLVEPESKEQEEHLHVLGLESLWRQVTLLPLSPLTCSLIHICAFIPRKQALLCARCWARGWRA